MDWFLSGCLSPKRITSYTIGSRRYAVGDDELYGTALRATL
ncbi:hypothetical protein [Porphyromonas gulae]|nr:hypothetical protein [Porphyromonas gulae]